MAASLDGVFPTTLQEKIKSSKLLVVGAGGIGCEILKNLVLSGFPEIEIIDLDTIDLSNLNRQFLFHREHVGKSKAQVARESALQFNPDVKIKAYHDSIMATDYGVNFFKKFDVVLNALDNRAARNHVNRMCLNAEVPLIESGTAGYNGQVELIKKGLTQCYECTPKAAQKSFPGCTIRNTPSEPIHCIVWAKHLFNQLFGETVDDEDISPDVADPEAQAESGEEKTAADDNAAAGDSAGGDMEMKSADENKESTVPKDGNVVRVNTRQWAKESNYDAETLFNKFFYDDIKYLLSMSNLWKSRKPPTPIKWESVLLKKGESEDDAYMRQYHKTWSLAECAGVFADCLKKLKANLEKIEEGDSLVWDKDDQPAMDFVAACANIRGYIFEIARKSRFEIKSMAGNIIPAIATTNAITAGVVVLQTFKVLQNELDKCKSVYMRLRPNPRQQLLVPEKFLTAPNPNCYVCAAEPAIHLRVDTKRMHIKEFRDEVLIKTLNMVNPDVIVDAKGVVVISSEEGETECNEGKLLSEMEIVDGVLLKCDDFFQNYELSIIIMHIDAERDEPMFEVIADKNQLKPKEEKEATSANEKENGKNDDMADGPSTSKKARISEVIEDDDDDLCVIEEDDDDVVEIKVPSEVTAEQVTAATDKLQVKSPEKSVALKRKPTDDDDVTEVLDSEDENGPTQSKRSRTSAPEAGGDVINID
ncbi:SUMO-activating enzyme subunit 2 [Lucilia cuprina]|uniref:SUMO-activating enzyme subunit 2 n=1 Tax=Lucilia cuprina TaxID=7375 RepID=UPI001F062B43|nr:SUMO-activating enzyme subunit 2 [Lucilia cuprina]XP_046808326.1 SUMO-activating enzyme subunit 2 [Lucilia cuprina]